MDANQLSLGILDFLKENLAKISHEQTLKSWGRALKRIAPVLEEKTALDKIKADESKGLANFTALAAKDRKFCLEIAQMRVETMLRDEYDLMLTRQDQRMASVLARMSANNKKGKDPDLKPWIRDGLKSQNQKLMAVIKKDTDRHALLRADLYLFIAYIHKFIPEN